MSYFDLKSLTIRWICLSLKPKGARPLASKRALQASRTSLVERFPFDVTWRVKAFCNQNPD